MPSGALSIVVVSYNTRNLLRRCLASIVDNPNHVFHTSHFTLHPSEPAPIPIEVIVVDNASSDGSADMVASEFPSVKLLAATSNLGFAAGTNRGLREATGDFLLLLNPDTEVMEDALPSMAGFLSTHPDAGAVGPALQYPDGSRQHSAFAFPTLAMAFLDFFPMNHRMLNSRLNGRYPTLPDGKPFRIGHPLGAAMMIRREALRSVGMLDEGFFMYCEEVDWCIRAVRCGWHIYSMPSARVIHHSGQSTSQFKDKMFVELNRSRYRLYRKHYSRAFIAANRLIVRAGVAREILRARAQASKGLIDRNEMKRRISAYRAVWDM